MGAGRSREGGPTLRRGRLGRARWGGGRLRACAWLGDGRCGFVAALFGRCKL